MVKKKLSPNLNKIIKGFPDPYVCIVGKKTFNIDSYKLPHLIVGTSNYIRDLVSLTLINNCDIYLFFLPTSLPIWQVGLIVINKSNPSIRTIIHSQEKSVKQNFTNLLKSINEDVNYLANADIPKPTIKELRLGNWFIRWIHKCPKISLQDVLHLEDYKNES